MKKEQKTVAFEGKTYNVFTVHAEFGDYDVILVAKEYDLDGSLAIEVMAVENGEVTDYFTRLTTYVNLFLQSDTRAFVDTNNNPWAEKFIKDNRLGKFAGKRCGGVYCTYPLYTFDTARFCRETA